MFKSILFTLTVAALFAGSAATFAGEIGVDVTFSDGEASIIRAYYRDHTASQNGKNNGKSKGGKALPPGIAKNLQRGKSLPPGIAKQALPSGLISRLPPPPKGYERIELSGKVLLIEIATQVIHDVLEDIVL
jgi:Ni/Co efflux regulator RcnB